MMDQFKRKGVVIDEVFFCPYHPEFGKGIYLKDSFDRKPNPGMIIKAANKYSINLKDSLFIGNNKTDYEASLKAGISYYVDANSKDWVRNTLKILRSI